MAHYDIFRHHLAVKFPAFGHALWEPDPGNLYPAVEIGDVGYICEGKFHRLFNVFLPPHDESHVNFGVPEYHEQLTLNIQEHINVGKLSPSNFCSPSVTSVQVSDRSADGPPSPDDIPKFTFWCPIKEGAVLCLPVQAKKEDTVASEDFGKWMIRHIDRWFVWARRLGLGIKQMEDIILVTGTHRTRSCTNVVFPGGRQDAQASFGAKLEHRDAVVILTWQYTHERDRGVVLNCGPDGEDLPEDQCIFIRGFRATRKLKILPPRLKAAAGPNPDLGDQGYDQDPDAELVQVPAVPEYRDPVHLILEYIAEEAPNCDMLLVHDDDLAQLDWTDDSTADGFQPTVVLSRIRRLKPMVHKHSIVLSSACNSTGAKTESTSVATLSNIFEKRFSDTHSPTLPEHQSAPLLAPSSSLSPVRPSTQNVTYHQNSPYARIPFNDSHGYLVRMFGARDAAFFLESLLKVDAQNVHLIVNVPGWPNALMVSRPSVPDTHPDALANQQPLWLLDFVPLPRLIVVTQQIWIPTNQSDWRHYVEQAHLRMPVFFVQNNGAIGLPLPRAAVGDTASLKNADKAAPLGGGHFTQIRIAWPGYELWERQILIWGQTRHRTEITLERFAKLVAGIVDRFLSHSATVATRDPTWRVGDGAITRNDVVIVGTVQVSAKGWMPILQIAEPLRMTEVTLG